MKSHRLMLVASLILVGLSLGQPLVEASPNLQSASPDVLELAQSPGMGNRRGDRKQQWMKELNLSQEQQQQLAAIQQKYKGQTEQLRQQLRTSQDELRNLMGGSASSDAIRAKNDQIVGLRQQLNKLRFESMLESRDIMSPQQRQQFTQLMNQRRTAGKGKWGGGGAKQN